jgi:hypothetical protein
VKIQLVLVWLCLTSVALADDKNLLQNGDFSSGLAHWQGDFDTIQAASSSGPSSAQSPTTGAVVKLRPTWSKLTQNFSAQMGDYVLTVKYALSPDLKFSSNSKDFGSVPNLIGLTNLGAFGSRIGQWCVIFFDANTLHSTFWRITPSHGSMTQTFTCRVQLDSDNDKEGKVLALAFPVGNGSMNLQNISFVRATTATGY